MKIFPWLFFGLLTLIFLNPVIFGGRVPFPGDNLVGHYYPWKDYVWEGREAGYPIKNFELNDALVQMYPWRELAVTEIKKGRWPLWNPYNFTGTPLLANFPTAIFYPLNALELIFPFALGWTIYIGLQTWLGGVFMYWYLNNQGLSKLSSLFGGLVFAWSSSMTTWYEYGITGHTWLWVPLVLSAIDKVQSNVIRQKSKLTSSKTWFEITLSLLNKWWLVGVGALTMMILGGFIQGVIYGYTIVAAYLGFRLYEGFKILSSDHVQSKRKIIEIKPNHHHKKRSGVYILVGLGLLAVPVLLSAIQWLPFGEMVVSSSRVVSNGGQGAGVDDYFLPWRRLITAMVPDFFGNPATGNFWGQTSYLEFAFYIGLIPLVLVLVGFLNKKPSAVEKYWRVALVLGLLFLLDSPLARLPYYMNIPGYAVLLPSRLTAVVTLTLAILAAYGLNSYQNAKVKDNRHLKSLVIWLTLLLVLLWEVVWLSGRIFIDKELVANLTTVAKRNLILPSGYLLLVSGFLTVDHKIRTKKLLQIGLVTLIAVTIFDLLHQGWKYNGFVPKSIIYPQTKSTEFLQNQKLPPRVMITHPELFPPNVNLVYRIPMLDSFDPVHDRRVERLLSTLNGQGLSGAVDFRRVTFSGNYQSRALNLFSPEYVFSLGKDLEAPGFQLVMQEGRSRLYKNLLAYPRVYLTKDVDYSTDDKEILQRVLDFSQKGERKAILESSLKLTNEDLKDYRAEIISYQPNEVDIKVSTNTDALLVFNDAYNEGWEAMVDSSQEPIFRANYAFRGVRVPEGNHWVRFIYDPQSFRIGMLISAGTVMGLGVILLMKKSRFILGG